jgi:hypothetical protein
MTTHTHTHTRTHTHTHSHTHTHTHTHTLTHASVIHLSCSLFTWISRDPEHACYICVNIEHKTIRHDNGTSSGLTFAPPDKITWPKSFWTPKGYLTSAAGAGGGGADPAFLLVAPCCCTAVCLMSPASPSSRHRPAMNQKSSEIKLRVCC